MPRVITPTIIGATVHLVIVDDLPYYDPRRPEWYTKRQELLNRIARAKAQRNKVLVRDLEKQLKEF